MSDKNLGHILFAITIVVIFSAFGAYAVFYRFASFMIRDSVQKTLIWSKLVDMQIRLQAEKKNVGITVTNLHEELFPPPYPALTWKRVFTDSSWELENIAYYNNGEGTVLFTGQAHEAILETIDEEEMGITDKFSSYYDEKTTEQNPMWQFAVKTEDFRISGPGADGVFGSTWGYLHHIGESVRLLGLSYRIVDHGGNANPDGPYEFSCPCDVRFRVFEGDPILLNDIPNRAIIRR